MDIFKTNFIIRKLHTSAHNFRTIKLIRSGKFDKKLKNIVLGQLYLMVIIITINIINYFLLKKEWIYPLLTVLTISIIISNNAIINYRMRREFKYFCKFYIFPNQIKKVSLDEQYYLRFSHFIKIRNISIHDLKKYYDWLLHNTKKIDFSIINIPIKIFSVGLLSSILVTINQIVTNDLKYYILISYILLIISFFVVITYVFINRKYFNNKQLKNNLYRVILEEDKNNSESQ